MEGAIRAVLAECGRLAVSPQDLRDTDNLFDAGLSSMATVNVMLALEERFGVEIPDRLLTRRSFESIGAIRSMLQELGAVGAEP
ncbi:MAG TPA: acyl carrier protein [Acetobacteraceae bacterium]|nr:acyl carrier protein [Acetobacteraceae bacterium]